MKKHILTPEMWADLRATHEVFVENLRSEDWTDEHFRRDAYVQMGLALLALPKDERPITKELVEVVRELAWNIEARHDDPEDDLWDDYDLYVRFTKLYKLADLLESFLPPEEL